LTFFDGWISAADDCRRLGGTGSGRKVNKKKKSPRSLRPLRGQIFTDQIS